MPVGFCVRRSILLSQSGWSAVIYLLLQLASFLNSLPRVWCNSFFLFVGFCIPRQVLLASSKMFLACFHCWFTASSYSLSCSYMLLRAWNLFLSCRTKAFLVLGSCSLLISYLGVVYLFGPAAQSFSLTFAVTRWWSLLASAPLFTITSSRERRHMLLTMRWSIWFWSLPFGDVQVSLWMLRCGNKVPPMIMLLNAHYSTSRSPLSFCSPHPSLPITFSKFMLSEPTLALRSPITSWRSLQWTFSSVACSCS